MTRLSIRALLAVITFAAVVACCGGLLLTQTADHSGVRRGIAAYIVVFGLCLVAVTGAIVGIWLTIGAMAANSPIDSSLPAEPTDEAEGGTSPYER